MGTIHAESRFAAIAWTKYTAENKYPMGLIAGGMVDGTVLIWDAASILAGDNETTALVTSLHKHVGGPVQALQFSPLSPSQLATGGANGQVWILDLATTDEAEEPCEGHKQAAEITAVAWNTQVAHILASSSADGSVAVWDLNSRSAWCELRAESTGQAVADMSWNPTVGLHLLTATADDRNPVIKVWDLGASTSMPLTTLQGHEAGLLRTSWCPHDDTLLLTCAKDNRTLLWDLYALQPIAEIPNHHAEEETSLHSQGAQPSSPATLFSSNTLKEQKHMRYDVLWSPLKRGVALTCSLDRKVQAHSVLSLATKSGRPPKWMKPAGSVSTGFGGMLISCNSKSKVVTLRTVCEQAVLVQTSKQLEAELQSTNIIEFCNARSQSIKNPTEKQMWGFMKVIFETNARQQLLQHLGFDAETIAAAANQFSEKASTNGVAPPPPPPDGRHPAAISSKAAEEMVKKALLVGNFEAAVECCFQTGNLADALVLASCGGADLWAKTQERYFKREALKRPYLSIVSAIIHNKLDDLVAESDTKWWQETLAILSTYGQSEEFPRLCIALGDRLEEVGDNESASLCYMCSLSLEKSVKFWKTQYAAAIKPSSPMNLLALHDFVVKVSIFIKAAGQKTQMPLDVAELFTKYAQILAEEGLFVTAAKYCEGNSQEGKILRDRLYRSRASQACYAVFGSAPEFPFAMVAVNKSRGQTTGNTGRQTQAQGKQTNINGTYNNTHQQATSAASTSTGPAAVNGQLPPGWVALKDPSSGRSYYANQTTGETTWEKPQATSVAQPVAQPSYTAPSATPATQAQQPQSSYTNSSVVAGQSTHSMASKYGDGFVTSASHPELAYQYGNVGTSNPYKGVTRPGTAASVVSSTHGTAPASGSFDIDSSELSDDLIPIKDALLGIVSALESAPLSVADKRQLIEAEKGVTVLMKKLARGAVGPEVQAQVYSMVGALANRDFTSATTIQTALVNSDWRNHKDWLKGIKSLIQLASKKLR